MKRHWLALLLLATSAHAATDPPTTGEAYQTFRYTSRYRHIAVLKPSSWGTLFQPNIATMRRDMFAQLGTIIETARTHGMDVHEYDQAFFESDKDHRDMWADLGAKYALTIVLYPVGNGYTTAQFARYVCADSTNTQLLIFGGSSSANSWRADTSCRGFVDDEGIYEAISDSTGNGAFLTMYGDNSTSPDTVWGTRLSCGRRLTNIASGMDSVYRLLRPQTINGPTIAFIQDGDSAGVGKAGGSFNPGYGPTLGTTAASWPLDDSTAHRGEYLGPMWKTKFTHGLTVDAGSRTYQNSLSAALCPTYVYWMKSAQSAFYDRGLTHLLWALICRFTLATPIAYAIDWDDVTDKQTDNLGQPPRWRNSAAESALVAMAAYGMTPMVGVNPRHAPAYVNGTNPDYETAWSGDAHSYLKRMSWFHHAHDSTAGNIGANLLGAYGGYSSGNGFIDVGIPQEFVFQHRYASRWNPGANEGGGIGAGGNFGIVQRYAYYDSLRRVLTGRVNQIPYFAAPGNINLPINWRARPTTANSNWTRYTVTSGTECPMDSVIWAYDRCVYGNNTSYTHYVMVRAEPTGPRGYLGTNVNSVGSTLEWDRDSVLASTWSELSNSAISQNVGGRKTTIIQENSYSFGQGTRSLYIRAAALKAQLLLGIKSQTILSDQSNQAVGETFSADLNGMYGGSITSEKDAPARQTTRIFYMHPGTQGQTATTMGDIVVEQFLRGAGSQIRMCDKIAGRRVTRCVPAWQVYWANR